MLNDLQGNVDKVAKLLKILRRATMESPAKQEDVARAMGGDITTAGLRNCFIHPLRERGVPIASSGRGMWLARKASELNETIAHLRARQASYTPIINGLVMAQYQIEKGVDPRTLQGELFGLMLGEQEEADNV